MRIATFLRDGQDSVGIVDVEHNRLLDLQSAWPSAPRSVEKFIEGGATALTGARNAVRSTEESGTFWVPLGECRLRAPIPRPSKNVFCVGRNYRLHIEEGARARGVEPIFPKAPEFFTKAPTTVIGHEDEVNVSENVTKQLDYEVELAVIIGKTCRDVSREDARSVIFGYTVLNDVSARDLQFRHVQFFKGKTLDTTCPIGPWIVTADEFGAPDGHRITLRVNGETRQDSVTTDMLFGIDEIIESLSAGLTLETGDIITTGTPSGVGMGLVPQVWLQEGDVVEAEIDGIGVLRNTIRRPA
ncbi:MAG: fumarylacetoacetate hydrolase family protein [Rhizobiaceae bacterium]|nr:fumarylacetoacetate hydrolase family protein [Rhizobiaceae bacterium]